MIFDLAFFVNVYLRMLNILFIYNVWKKNIKKMRFLRKEEFIFGLVGEFK